MRKLALSVVFVICVAAIIQTIAMAQEKKKTIRRAKPPTFDSKDVQRIFFDDVFDADGGGLAGSRPDDLGKVAAPVVSSTKPSTEGSGGGSQGGLYAWKDIIAAEVIEDEIKAIATNLNTIVTTPTVYAGGVYKEARRDFSILAMMFAVTSEYDAAVRWQKDAPELRDQFSRAAGSAKVGSQAAYMEAKRRRDELTELVRGTAFTSVKPGEPKASWSEVVDRSPLMLRLEIAQNGILKPLTGNAGDFKANKDKILHEASIVAAIGEVLSQNDMEDGSEAEYKAFAVNMKNAAREILEAIQLDNYEAASKSVGAIGQACSQCHSDWR